MSRIRHQFIASIVMGSGLVFYACDNARPPQQDSSENQAEIIGSQVIMTEDEYCGDPDLLASDGPLEATSPSGDYTVRITDLPRPIPSNQVFSFPIEVTRSSATGEHPASVRADAGMPQHGHGLVVDPSVQPTHGTSGLFEVSGMMLHMPGSWELYIDIFDGPYSERVIFHVQAR